MLRTFFLSLSRNQLMRTRLTRLSFARRAAGRFVAGEEPEDAIRVCRELNAKGILVTLDHLGENVTTAAEAEAARDAYLHILDRIHETGVKSHVSLKLTQFGLDISEGLCLENVADVVERAQQYQTFVRVDMESTEYTDRTLATWRALWGQFKNVGIVIQAYLYRSEQDIRTILDVGGRVRLCKGAYNEPPEKAFPKKADVDANFVKLMQIMLSQEARAKGAHIAVATHDPKMIAATKQYVAQHQIPKDQFEFQMLHGIRRDLQEQLVRDGYGMRVYVPYGREWYPYFMRRMAERPANFWFLVRNVVRIG